MTVVFDAKPNDGPLAGIQAALAWAAAKYGPKSYLLTVSTDTPFVPRDLAARLMSRLKEAQAEIATTASESGRHPTISLWQAGLGAGLGSWMNEQTDRSIRGFIDTRSNTTVRFDGPIDPFFNVNTPADLTTAEDLVRLNPNA